MEKEIPANSSNAAAVADELPCLSGDKPFFDVISKSYLKNPVVVPTHTVSNFPNVAAPMVRTHGGKKWDMPYIGKDKHRFDRTGWRRFAADNSLKCGDACIFEVMESSSEIVRLRVIILRQIQELPPELDDGNTPQTPILLDKILLCVACA